MNTIVLFDGVEREGLLPLTYLRPVAACQVGMLTIAEKWQYLLGAKSTYATVPYIQDIYPRISVSTLSKWINGAVLPSYHLAEAIDKLQPGQRLTTDDRLIAACPTGDILNTDDLFRDIENMQAVTTKAEFLTFPEDVLTHCDEQFRMDYKLLTKGQVSGRIPSHVVYRGKDIFIHPTARVYDCLLNATDGPIYIGADAEVMEMAVIKGPVGIGANSTIHVGAKVYAHTMLGLHCKIGGEIKRSTLFGYTNKAHDGYLGDSVLGQWCNLGADTNVSNMKNTYGQVRLWSPREDAYRLTQRQFLGIVMGDHTMSAINTAFMTGSMTGVFANVFGTINPSKWNPCFSWGSREVAYNVEKAIAVAQRAMSRRDIHISEAYIRALRHIADQ